MGRNSSWEDYKTFITIWIVIELLCRESRVSVIKVRLYCAAYGMANRDSEVAKEIGKRQAFEEHGWTQEQYDMYELVRDMTNEHPVFEFYNAVTESVAEMINNPMKEGSMSALRHGNEHNVLHIAEILNNVVIGVKSIYSHRIEKCFSVCDIRRSYLP